MTAAYIHHYIQPNEPCLSRWLVLRPWCRASYGWACYFVFISWIVCWALIVFHLHSVPTLPCCFIFAFYSISRLKTHLLTQLHSLASLYHPRQRCRSWYSSHFLQMGVATSTKDDGSVLGFFYSECGSASYYYI